jgi:hypothetical protein
MLLEQATACGFCKKVGGRKLGLQLIENTVFGLNHFKFIIIALNGLG